MNFLLEPRKVFSFRQAQVVFTLQVEPELGVDPEIKAQPQSGVSRYSPFAGHDQLQGWLRNTRIFCHPVNCKVVWPDELCEQDFSRGEDANSFHSSMIINDFNFVRVAAAPPETDSPLAIDQNAVLPFSVAFQGFQFISRWHLKVFQPNRRVQYP